MPEAPASRPSSTRPASRSRAPPTASRSPPCPPPSSKTSTSAPPTAPRAGNSVVPANAGTHTPRPLEGALWQLPLLTQTPVVMGPCVRRDDDGIGADGSSSRTPSTRRPCERRAPRVSAIALIATPRPFNLSAAARRLSNNEHRWLWVPAFAGTTMELEQMASSQTPSTRRPCERRDPRVSAIALIATPRLLSLSAAARRLSNNEHRWLWVPAFAGTTMELEQMASSQTPSTRRPCERRDPRVSAIALIATPRLLSLSAAARRLSNNEHRWLWVPAFAGTTM